MFNRCRAVRFSLLAIFVAALTTTGQTRAAITLTLNTVDKTLSFSGTDTGQPFAIPDQGFVGWRSVPYTGTPTFFVFKAFFTSNSTIAETNTFLFQNTEGSLIGISLPNPGNPPFDVITVMADATKMFAYGTMLTESQATALEVAVSGQPTFPVNSGSGFSPISTQVVPEPGTFALVMFAAAMWGGRRKRAFKVHGVTA